MTVQPIIALTAAVDAAGYDQAIRHSWDSDDIAAWWALPAAARDACLSCLSDTAERRAGRVPAGHAAIVRCWHCGPVWVAPAMARALTTDLHGPLALACPWCEVRATVAAIPQPAITCQDCMHRVSDLHNPTAAMGRCAAGQGCHYPGARHRCARWWPRSDAAAISA